MPAKAGQDQDRRLDLRNAQGAQHFEAGHVRKVQVEEDDVVVVDLAKIDPFLAEIGRVDVEALGFEHHSIDCAVALSSSISKTRMPVPFLAARA
jgi:hypothetical protein